MNSIQFFSTNTFKKVSIYQLAQEKSREKIKEKSREWVHSIVERKNKDDPIFDKRKVKSNAIDYRLPIDSSNLANNPSNSFQVSTSKQKSKLDKFTVSVIQI